MKKSVGVTHFIADCRNCEWHSENHKNGQAMAAKHAKFHKHRVTWEIGLAGTYDARPVTNDATKHTNLEK